MTSKQRPKNWWLVLVTSPVLTWVIFFKTRKILELLKFVFFSGPLISPAAKEKVERLITSAEAAGADILLDGRNLNVSFNHVFEVCLVHIKHKLKVSELSGR